MRIQHQIFRTPHAISPTFVERPNPGYTGTDERGRQLGETIPMWRVQLIGDIDRRDDYEMFGLVSRPRGFLDSPDTEIISGGVNSKAYDAIAIGRHASYLHWGFIASPTHMTDEARLVFVNAIHYIAGFDGAQVLARKRPGTVLRYGLDDAIGRVQASAPGPDRLAPLVPFVGEARLESFDGDAERAVAYVREKSAYLRPIEGWFKVEIDAELETLGLPNHSPEFLERMGAMLTNEDDAPLAQTLLARYSDQQFTEPSAWSDWLEAGRGHFYFSETAGYLWLVDNRAAAIEASVKSDKNSPLHWKGTVAPDGDGRYRVTVALAIRKGWHAYDRVPSHLPYCPVALRLMSEDGESLDVEWTRPSSTASQEHEGVFEWTGDVSFTATFEIASDQGGRGVPRVDCELTYQVCNDESCLPVKKETLRLSAGDR